MTESVSPRVWRWAIGGLLGSGLAITLVVIFIFIGGAPPLQPMLLAGFDDRWSIQSGTIQADRLQLRSGPNSIGLALHPIDSSAFTFEARLTIGDSDAAAGLIVNAIDAQHFTAFLISRDGYFSVTDFAAGRWIDRVAWREWPHVRRGDQANTLRAECDRSTCVFFVNDERTWQVDGLPFGAMIGLVAHGPSAAAIVTCTQVTAQRR